MNIEKLTAQLTRRFASIVGVGKLHKNDGKHAQATFGNLTKDRVPMVQHYGFKSVPPDGSKCLAVSNGQQETYIVIGSADTKELGLKEGETAIYSGKAKVVLSDGKITIEGDSVDVKTETIVGGNPVTTNCICAFTGTKHPHGDPSITIGKK